MEKHVLTKNVDLSINIKILTFYENYGEKLWTCTANIISSQIVTIIIRLGTKKS